MDKLKNNWSLVLLAVLLLYYGGRYLYFLPKYDAGERAPDFSGQLIDGADFSLAQLRGQYVLLHFWGSWCGPCRRENPELRELYREFAFAEADPRLAIVSVGIERDSLRWQEALLRDGLDWPYHLMDGTESLRFFGGPVAERYGVRAVPMHYLIGPDGELLLADPSPAEVRAFLRP
jgi:thiol-disulfide isomerase/thioredoxin